MRLFSVQLPTKGDFPPSSKDTLFRLDSAANFMMIFPTSVEPVNATFDNVYSTGSNILKKNAFEPYLCPDVWPLPLRQ